MITVLLDVKRMEMHKRDNSGLFILGKEMLKGIQYTGPEFTRQEFLVYVQVLGNVARH